MSLSGVQPAVIEALIQGFYCCHLNLAKSDIWRRRWKCRVLCFPSTTFDVHPEKAEKNHIYQFPWDRFVFCNPILWHQFDNEGLSVSEDLKSRMSLCSNKILMNFYGSVIWQKHHLTNLKTSAVNAAIPTCTMVSLRGSRNQQNVLNLFFHTVYSIPASDLQQLHQTYNSTKMQQVLWSDELSPKPQSQHYWSSVGSSWQRT